MPTQRTVTELSTGTHGRIEPHSSLILYLSRLRVLTAFPPKHTLACRGGTAVLEKGGKFTVNEMHGPIVERLSLGVGGIAIQSGELISVGDSAVSARCVFVCWLLCRKRAETLDIFGKSCVILITLSGEHILNGK